MEVLLFNLSLKRFILKLESSHPQAWSPAACWHVAPQVVYPAALLDGSSLSDFSFVNFSLIYVLAGFTVNECRLQYCFCYTLDAVRLLITFSRTQVKQKMGFAPRDGLDSTPSGAMLIRSLRARPGQGETGNGEIGRLNWDWEWRTAQCLWKTFRARKQCRFLNSDF